MKKLLSLPPNLVGCFHDITGYAPEEWFCTNDPVGHKLGSGGGSAWLLWQAFLRDARFHAADPAAHTRAGQESESSPSALLTSFKTWLKSERRILLHAGGQSRRLPAYAPSGKVLTPIPVFRWERGQRLGQDLLSLQVPLYERIMEAAPPSLGTMIVSGDVFIRTTEPLGEIPEADVVCFGLWLNPEIAKAHGVFVSSRRTPSQLKMMLQKPSLETLGDLLRNHYYLTDIGVWLLSDRAVETLFQKSLNASKEEPPASFKTYDLYSDFGCSLGTHPDGPFDEEVNRLTVAVLPLPGGEFYHFGTSRELLSSTLAIQNLVNDQRRLLHKSRKPHPSMFVQNAETWATIGSENQNLWIENSSVSERWTLTQNHIITGVPDNNWQMSLSPGQCIDIVPVGKSQWVVRPYGYFDRFDKVSSFGEATFLGQPLEQWLAERNVFVKPCTEHSHLTQTPQAKNELHNAPSHVSRHVAIDLQQLPLFPIVDNVHDMGLVLRWMLNEPQQEGGRVIWLRTRRLSAEQIAAEANLRRLVSQREEFRARRWPFLAHNYRHSVFYQTDLEDAAHEFARHNLAEPTPLPPDEDNELISPITRMNDAMFRSELSRLRGNDGKQSEERAFELLRDSLLNESSKVLPLARQSRQPSPGHHVQTLRVHIQKDEQTPSQTKAGKGADALTVETAKPSASSQVHHETLANDQIVWGRSPVRIDIAGGWTDTPPFCLMEGGNVVNLAIELNHQPPIQTYVKPCPQPHIVLRSIDLGATEVVETYDQLARFNQVGSPFAIPKAALALCGFHPRYAPVEGVTGRYPCADTLVHQLQQLGCGLEVTLLSAIPAGSGLGTSSIIAATVLATLSDFCHLGWDKSQIGHNTLMLEQMLTTGGGWQDQFGGLLQGVKLLQTTPGYDQQPTMRWLPTDLYTMADYRDCHLLYYTGITRTAKHILTQIVRRMFLNQEAQLRLLRQMKDHALEMHDAIAQNQFERMGRLVRKTWQQNQQLDSGTNPASIARLTSLIDDLCLGYKLPGAGGGGYLYMVAKDPEAARRIRQILNQNPPNRNARFVEMSLSLQGLQVSRS